MTFPSALATNWILANIDTGEELEGDFEAQNITRDVSASYAEHHTLNRQSPITQFLHGNTDTLSFEGRFFMDPAILSLSGLPFAGPVSRFLSDGTDTRFSLRPGEKLKKIEEWVGIDADLQRPPIVQFSVGDGELSQVSYIESVTNIRYDRPLITGEVRGVTFVVNLKKFIPFDIDLAEQPAPESRYAHVKEGEYYELLAQLEYGVPMLGVVVQQRNPTAAILEEGDVVKLPSLRAIQSQQVNPSSIAFTNLNSKQPSAQKTLKNLVLDRLNRDRYSAIVPEGI